MKRLLFLMLIANVFLHVGCGGTPTLSPEELSKRETESKASMTQGMDAMKGSMKQIEAGKAKK